MKSLLVSNNYFHYYLVMGTRPPPSSQDQDRGILLRSRATPLGSVSRWKVPVQYLFNPSETDADGFTLLVH